MKQKFRLLKRSMVFCALAFLSCQDDFPDQIGNDTHAHSKHTYLDFETFSQQFPETASKVRTQNDKTNEHLQRGVYDPENDFTIETDKVFVGKNEGGTYLTFAVNRESTSFEGIENLVLKSDNQGGYIPMLTKYDISAEEKNELLIGGEISNLESKFSVEMLENVNFGQDLTIAGKYECSSFMVGFCENGIISHGGGYEDNETRCRGYKEKFITACGDSDGGGSMGGGSSGGSSSPSTPNTGNSPGQSSGGGGNPGTGNYNPNGPSIPVITTPLPGEEVEVQIVDPCVKLKEKASNLVFNNKVAQLKSPNVYALDHEKGFVETLSPYKKSMYTNVEGTAMSNNISIPRSMNAIGIVHVHNNDYVNQQGTLVNTIKILSPEDVLSLINFQNNAIAQGVSYSDAYVEMLSSEGHFVIRLLEPVDSNFFTNLQFIKFNREYNNKAVKMIEDGNFNSENLQKMLLGFLKEYGLENKVALYIATNDAVTQWSRLTLNPQNPNNLPIKTPCN